MRCISDWPTFHEQSRPWQQVPVPTPGGSYTGRSARKNTISENMQWKRNHLMLLFLSLTRFIFGWKLSTQGDQWLTPNHWKYFDLDHCMPNSCTMEIWLFFYVLFFFILCVCVCVCGGGGGGVACTNSPYFSYIQILEYCESLCWCLTIYIFYWLNGLIFFFFSCLGL